MNKILTLTVLAAMMALGASAARADGPFPTIMTDGTYGPAGQVTPNSNTGEFEIYNALNQLLGNSYTNNASYNNLEYTGDASTWQALGSNGGYAVIGLGAGATNTFVTYNVNTPNTLISPLGGGFTGDGSLNPYYGTQLVFPTGTQFGFGLSQNFNNVVTNWYSNPNLNSDGMDHMLVYNLSSLAGTTLNIYDPTTQTYQVATLQDPYFLAFEDTTIGNGTNGYPSDTDYNDLMVLVDGVAPVPEPMTVALFAFGLLAVAVFGLRRKFAVVA
jgi:hypothetical protein